MVSPWSRILISSLGSIGYGVRSTEYRWQNLVCTCLILTCMMQRLLSSPVNPWYICYLWICASIVPRASGDQRGSSQQIRDWLGDLHCWSVAWIQPWEVVQVCPSGISKVQITCDCTLYILDKVDVDLECQAPERSPTICLQSVLGSIMWPSRYAIDWINDAGTSSTSGERVKAQ